MSNPHEHDEDLSQDARRHAEDLGHHPDKPRREHRPVDQETREDGD